MSMDGAPSFPPTPAEIDEESRNIRRLRVVVNLSLSLIAEGDLPLAEAQKLAASARHLAEDLFPGKGDVYELVYGSKFYRLIRAIYGDTRNTSAGHTYLVQ